MEDELITSFLKTSVDRMKENLERTRSCLNQLSEKEVWYRVNKSSNSIGNLVLHLNGNIGQYILSALGDKRDDRKRSLEFGETERPDKSTLLEKHSEIVKEACGIMAIKSVESLHMVRKVQAYHVDGMEIIVHVVEHYSYHTGQIAYITKMLKDVDLGFYAGVDLDQTS